MLPDKRKALEAAGFRVGTAEEFLMGEVMLKAPFLPMTFSRWDEAGDNYGDIMYYDICFLEDFGPIKKGTQYSSACLFHENSCIVIYDKDATVILNIPLKLVPNV